MSGLPEVHLSSLAYTVGHWLPRMYDAHGEDGRDPFDLNAPYQRGSVWTVDQRRALIKSLYMGLPVGAVIVSVLPNRQGNPYAYRIVDGKQRIETVRAFAADGFAIPYGWLRDEDRFPADAPIAVPVFVFFSECPRQFQRWFEMTAQLPALEFKPEHEWMGRDAHGKAKWRKRNDAEILRAEAELYALVNSGGTPQSEEDLVRALSVAEESCP